jgi:hypothetical protein
MRRAILAACALVVVASAPPPAGAARAAPHCDPGRVVAAPAGTRSLAAVARRALVAYRRPGGAIVKGFHRLDRNDYPTTFAVIALRRTARCAPAWYRVRLPLRPNGTTGWIRAGAVRIWTLDTRIVVRVRARTLTLYRGRRVALRTPISTGAPETPTPVGRFYVTERFALENPTGVWGPAALGTSAYSVLRNWPQGGPVGIHGTNDPSAIGRAASHGCLRVPNATMKRLFEATPAGTPILIGR